MISEGKTHAYTQMNQFATTHFEFYLKKTQSQCNMISNFHAHQQLTTVFTIF